VTQLRNIPLFILAVAFPAVVIAQSTFGEFVGTVKDQSGGVIAGCAVTVQNSGTSATRSTVTDSTGNYTVVNLEPGTYEITVTMPGFQKAVYSNLQLLARQTVRVDSSLEIGSAGQSIEVSTAKEAPINTEVSNIAESKLGREWWTCPSRLPRVRSAPPARSLR
jgi:Carboxypeptidase regulatory-like domain